MLRSLVGSEMCIRDSLYAVAYTFYSSNHGIETPPSPFSQLWVGAYADSGNQGIAFRRSAVAINISDYLTGLPDWADQVRFYVKRLTGETDVLEPKNFPYKFTYIGGPGREDLEDNITATYQWANEEHEVGFLESQEYETEPNQEGIESILAYASRLWGYDRDLHVIRFSHINRPDVMPYTDSRLPHAVRIDGAWQNRVEALELMPGNGGIYVFFPRAIRTIRGQQILTGLHTIEVSPETDIDATGGINGRGTRSPYSIVSDGHVIYYLDTDRRVYALAGEGNVSTEDFSLSIQPFLDEASDDEIREARAIMWQKRYHLMVGDETYILDTQRNYWTIWDVRIDSILHSVGGEEDEDVLYALIDNQVVELYNGDADDDTEWMWITNYVEPPLQTRISEIILPHPENVPPVVEMRIETERGISDWQEYEVHAGNFYRLGTFAIADVRARVFIRGKGTIPRFNELTIGVS